MAEVETEPEGCETIKRLTNRGAEVEKRERHYY